MSKPQLWAGRILTGLPALFLLMDAVMKFVQPKEVVDATVQLGYGASAILPLGITLLFSLILYLYPRTSILGAILLTGYLGGAVATHVRIDNPLFSHVLFPVYIGIMLWAGLYFRNPQFQKLFKPA